MPSVSGTLGNLLTRVLPAGDGRSFVDEDHAVVESYSQRDNFQMLPVPFTPESQVRFDAMQRDIMLLRCARRSR